LVERVVNKLHFFRDMAENHTGIPRENGPRIPEWTTEIETARSWARDGRRVVVRRLLSAHEGRGIEIHTEADAIPSAPLYTKYIPKDGEYRIHIVAGQVIDVQKKVLRADIPRDTADRTIRNTANGYVFARNNIQVPPDVQAQALLAMQASGLDFAAADVIWNERRQQAFVLELNTAPGIVGTTVRNYATALRSYIEQTN
jgi:glutathione synthase/RimK-type ligase-like ATP-grasp enzyme